MRVCVYKNPLVGSRFGIKSYALTDTQSRSPFVKVDPGVYKVSIVASESGSSKTFPDVLEVKVR